MCLPGYHHNGFVAVVHLGTWCTIYGYTIYTHNIHTYIYITWKIPYALAALKKKQMIFLWIPAGPLSSFRGRGSHEVTAIKQLK